VVAHNLYHYLSCNGTGDDVLHCRMARWDRYYDAIGINYEYTLALTSVPLTNNEISDFAPSRISMIMTCGLVRLKRCGQSQ